MNARWKYVPFSLSAVSFNRHRSISLFTAFWLFVGGLTFWSSHEIVLANQIDSDEPNVGATSATENKSVFKGSRKLANTAEGACTSVCNTISRHFPTSLPLDPRLPYLSLKRIGYAIQPMLPRVYPPLAENCVGENISLPDGRFFIQYTDFTIPGRIPIEIIRYYDTTSPCDGVLGYGWALNYHKRLIRREDKSLLLREDGQSDTLFLHVGDDDYICLTNDRTDISPDGDGGFKVDRANITYSFDSDGKLSSIDDPYGNRLVFSYTSGKFPIYGGKSIIARDYRLLRIGEISDRLPTGRYVEFHYNKSGRIGRISDFTHREVTYEYSNDDIGLLICFTDAHKNNYRYSYKDNLMTSFNPPGRCNVTYQNSYDDNHRVTRQQQDSLTIDISYSNKNNAAVHLTRIESNDGQKKDELRKYYFDVNGHTIRIEAPSWRSIYIYDSLNNLIAKTSIRNLNSNSPTLTALTYDYDGSGNLTEVTSVTDNQEIVCKYGYDAFNRLTSSITTTRDTPINASSKPGIETKFKPCQSPQLVAHALGNYQVEDRNVCRCRKVQYFYNQKGKLKEVKCCVGKDDSYQIEDCATTQFTYNSQGDLVSIIGPKSRRVVIFRDSLGFPKSIFDTSDKRRKIDYVYDEIGRLVEIHDAMRTAVSAKYVQSPVEKSIVPDSSSSNYAKITLQTHPLEQEHLTLVYDGIGRLVSIRNDNGSVDLIYDIRGRLTKLRGNLVILSNVGCFTETFPLIKEASQKYAESNGTIIYGYNDQNNLTFAANDKGDFISYKRDRWGRIISRTSNNDIAVRFAYDLDSRLISVTDRKGVGILYIYDDAGKLKDIKYTHRDNLHLMYDEPSDYAESARVRAIFSDNGYKLSLRRDNRDRIVEISYKKDNEVIFAVKNHEEGISIESLVKDNHLSIAHRNSLHEMLDAFVMACRYLHLVNDIDVNHFLRHLRECNIEQVSGSRLPMSLCAQRGDVPITQGEKHKSQGIYSMEDMLYLESLRTVDRTNILASICNLEDEILAPLISIRDQVAQVEW